MELPKQFVIGTIVPAGEGHNLEFKYYHIRNLLGNQLNLIKDTICAFLNSGSGTILIGVYDNGQVTGVNYSLKEIDSIKIQIDNLYRELCLSDGTKIIDVAEIKVEVIPCVHPVSHKNTSLNIVAITCKVNTTKINPDCYFQYLSGRAVYRLNASNYDAKCERFYREHELIKEINERSKRLNGSIKDLSERNRGLANQNIDFNKKLTVATSSKVSIEQTLQRIATEKSDLETQIQQLTDNLEQITSQQNMLEIVFSQSINQLIKLIGIIIINKNNHHVSHHC